MPKQTFEQSALPHFSQLDPAQIEPILQVMLDQNRLLIDTLLATSESYTWDNLMQPLEDMNDELGKYWSPISHMHAVMETEALRDAYNKALTILTTYHTEISQNTNLFNAISAIASRSDFADLNPAQRKIIENDIRNFKLSGIHLSAEKKLRFAELEQQLSQLMTTFSEHLLDATQGWTLHISDVAELEGLPTQALQLALENAKKRNLEGYLLTLDYPSYSASIRFLKNRDLRRQMHEAHVTRASDIGPNAGKWDNTEIINQILAVRHEMAQLVDFENYAEYSLATKMAKKSAVVLKFLHDLAAKSKPYALKELQEVAAIAKKLDNIDTLEAWDIAFYSEKLQEATFHFTEEDLRAYFPIDNVLTGLFTVVNKLYGITVEENKQIEVWHPDVHFFSIYDKENNLRGGFYIDLYARTHKRDGAWMDECRVRRRLREDHLQYPVAYLTCNFMPPLDNQRALLTHDEVITLFHEFGHCLHHMLTTVDYAGVAGINGVEWDAVEFPSQFLENFCWEKEALMLLAKHYQTGEPLPEELYKKMTAAKHFQTGLQMVRQLEFSLFDFRLHLEFEPNKKQQVQTILNEVRQETAVVKTPAFNRFQHSFAHIFSGSYAAGYYSYKWAEVLSADAYAKFKENGIFDAATGLSFMQNILEVGGVRDPMASFIAFRGREPNIDALLIHSGIAE